MYNNNFNNVNDGQMMNYGYQGQQNMGIRYPQSAINMPIYPNIAAAAPSQPQSFLKCRPVVSLEEARAAQIDLDGSLHVFPDVGNKKIYTKQITPNGTASLMVYKLVEDADAGSSSFITRDEVIELFKEFRQSLVPESAEPAAAASKPNFKF